MKIAVINTFEDSLEALQENPQWREQMRAIILSEELLTLPKRFESFIRDEFKPLKKKVDKIESDVEILKKDVEILKQDVRGLKVDVASLKGETFELRIRDRAAAFFGKLLRKTKVINSEKLVDALDDALDAGAITDEERDDVLNVDVVVKGKMKGSDKEVILVGEVSVTVDLEDVERASSRARVISKAFNMEAIGVVVGKEVTERAKKAADELAVLVL